LERYFDAQIQAARRVGSQPCPGEEICQQIGPLAQYANQPVEEVCGGCSKRDTKPGQQPRAISDAIAEALTLDELRGVGATFAYPDGLSVYQWTCLKALERSRHREKEKQAAQQQASAEQARLQARMGGR
jgi:hypothetical protein